MLTLLNIGNTHTQMATWDGGSISPVRVVQTRELSWEMLPNDGPIAACSVVPEVVERLAGHGIFWLNTRVDTGLALQVNADTFGSDRLANAVALAELHTLPGVVIDCGTAITFEVVDAARTVRGGAIAPGRQLMRQALHRGTAQLPLVPLSTNVPTAIGVDTVRAIQLGVDGGAVGMVRAILRAIQAELGELRSVVVVGGDAGYFCRELPEAVPGAADFTLRGVLSAWRRNQPA